MQRESILPSIIQVQVLVSLPFESKYFHSQKKYYSCFRNLNNAELWQFTFVSLCQPENLRLSYLLSSLPLALSRDLAGAGSTCMPTNDIKE